MKTPTSKQILPEFPRIPHYPYKVNAVAGDIVSSDEDIKKALYGTMVPPPVITVEEKVDGANSAICLYEDDPIIRNRTHVLNKGYVKDTPAKKQFTRIWNWYYDHKDQFEALNEAAGFPAAVYGEWCYALHGIRYDRLPEFFVAYDIYDFEQGHFLPTTQTRRLLADAGFALVPLLFQDVTVPEPFTLESFCNEPSPFCTEDRREGVVVKVSNDRQLLHRYKMVRADFVQGCNWNEETITKNRLA
jgi:ATP-dependent RNA circularization protein (DNA/RNA ligase family)